jgi:multidrug efflux pump subunit AcrA (membrane-fusion protein)
MSAKVTFLGKDYDVSKADDPAILTVNSAAVVTRDDRQVAFLIRDDHVSEIAVKTGRRLGDRIEILEGLASGDRVVLRPDPSLSSGSAVVVK